MNIDELAQLQNASKVTAEIAKARSKVSSRSVPVRAGGKRFRPAAKIDMRLAIYPTRMMFDANGHEENHQSYLQLD